MDRDGIVNIANHNEDFVITFGRAERGAHVMSPRKVQGREALVRFLETELRFTKDGVADMMGQIDTMGSAHSNVIKMSDEERLRLGLMDPNEK